MNNIPSAKGEASIEVYGLDRPQLVSNRTNVAKRMISHLRNTRNLLRWHKDDPADDELRLAYEENIADLRQMMAPDQQYLAILEQFCGVNFLITQIFFSENLELTYCRRNTAEGLQGKSN